MTCIRDIVDEDALEREFDTIRRYFKSRNKGDVLRIEWGTKEAFEFRRTLSRCIGW